MLSMLVSLDDFALVVQCVCGRQLTLTPTSGVQCTTCRLTYVADYLFTEDNEVHLWATTADSNYCPHPGIFRGSKELCGVCGVIVN